MSEEKVLSRLIANYTNVLPLRDDYDLQTLRARAHGLQLIHERNLEKISALDTTLTFSPGFKRRALRLVRKHYNEKTRFVNRTKKALKNMIRFTTIYGGKTVRYKSKHVFKVPDMVLHGQESLWVKLEGRTLILRPKQFYTKDELEVIDDENPNLG